VPNSWRSRRSSQNGGAVVRTSATESRRPLRSYVSLFVRPRQRASRSLRFVERRDRAKLSVDVMVMAFAATFGGALVYTSDLDDLQRLSRYFPEVRLLAV
jgi:hypothetical protein